jgi:hypothetical protein
MFERLKLGVIYLSRDRFDFYTPDVPNVLSYYFPKELVSDLEVKNKEELDIQIQGFMHRNKLITSNLILVLSEHVCFMKDIPSNPAVSYEIEMGNFSAQVPFEHPTAKLYLLEKSARVVVTNRDLFETIRDAFNRQSMYVLMVIPAFVVNNPVHFVHGLDRDTGKEIITKMESYRVHDMLAMGKVEKETVKKEGLVMTKPVANTDQKQLYLLIGILGILLVVLVAMIVIMKPFG